MIKKFQTQNVDDCILINDAVVLSNYMVHFTRGVNDGALTKIPNFLQYIISMPIYHTNELYKYWNSGLFYLLITNN